MSGSNPRPPIPTTGATPVERLQNFIERERSYLEGLSVDISWSSSRWDVERWLHTRGKQQPLVFITRPKGVPEGLALPPSKEPLPEEFANFCKAVAVYFQRTRNLGRAAVSVYVDDLRRLYNCLYMRSERCPTRLTASDFEEAIRHLQETNGSGVYDSAARLQAIGQVIDQYGFTSFPLQFSHQVQPVSRYLRYVSLTDPERQEKLRRDDEKLPSKEAMEAFAVCTNNPINGNEEILLRTIDLLIAMGQRVNEITCIPLDCWVEQPVKDAEGKVTKDAHGNAIVEVGIRYYPEKNLEPRTHWLSDFDVPLARRAVERLTLLTAQCREVAKWQESNPGRLWQYAADDEIHEDDLLKVLSFASHRNLYLYLTQSLKVFPCRESRNGVRKERYYRAGEIECVLLPELRSHIVLKGPGADGNRVVLRTSDTLSIRFDGAFRFIRAANILKVLPRVVSVTEINCALGANPASQSIFDRRGLSEVNGDRIHLTSHQPRHWRNTLYDLAGMSNVQQALAMGRSRLDQNIAYQHTNLLERTQSHSDFISFNSVGEKMAYMHEGIRTKTVFGNITDTYHHLRDVSGAESAERFLLTHAQAMHITPYGACGHDFSQKPCPKHVQCWNNCSHLHRTPSAAEEAQLRIEIAAQEQLLSKLKEFGDGDFGSDVWVADQENKLKNMKMALDLKPTTHPVQVFPRGVSIPTQTLGHHGSSVDDD